MYRNRCSSRHSILAISIALAFGLSPAYAASEDGRFPSLEDGALIPFRAADQSVQAVYVEDDKVEKSLAPALALFCEPEAAKGGSCELTGVEREKLGSSDGVSSYTRLRAAVLIRNADGTTRVDSNNLTVKMLRSCPSGAVLVTPSNNDVANRSPDTGLSAQACRWLAAAPTEKSLGVPRESVGLTCPVGNAPLVGNPINPSTLSKIEVVTDIAAPESSPLSFVRTYQSAAFPLQSQFVETSIVYPAPARMGARWRHNFDRRLVAKRYYDRANEKFIEAIYLVAEDGRETPFIPSGEGYASEPDERGLLAVDGDGWSYALPAGTIERFDAKGYLSSRADSNGRLTTFTYEVGEAASSQRLLAVTDWNGRALHFEYDGAGRMSAITAPDGARATYEYSETLASGLDADLAKVTYPDGKFVRYLYDEPEMGGTPTHKLTGIVREDGQRYATFRYDSDNHAEVSEHGHGLESTRLSQYSNGIVTSKTMDGREETFRATTILGVPRVTAREEHFGLGVIKRAYEYGLNGRLSSLTDYLSVPTSYRYDDVRGLETERSEAEGTPVARRTKTHWHPVFDLPTRIEQGDSWVDYTYDQHANLVEEREGGPAAVGGEDGRAGIVERVTRYSYDPSGHLAAIDGPSEGTADTIRFSYYDSDAPRCGVGGTGCDWRKGDLHTITDPVGLTERFLRYDGAGRLLSKTDANDVRTDYLYDARGRLLKTEVSATNGVAQASEAIVSTASYNEIGLVAQTVDPDGVKMNYSYDAAHRLVAQVDSLGNRRELTPNGIGLPVAEIFKGLDGTIQYDVSRKFDPRGQLLSEHSAAGMDHSFFYDANSRLTQRRVAAGMTLEQRTLDARGRISSVVYAPFDVKAKIGLLYDGLDKVSSVVDPNELQTTYQHSGLGHVLRLASPDTGVTLTEYDEAGRLRRRVTADGKETLRTYDPAGRLLSVAYGVGKEEQYTYDIAPAACGVGQRYSKGRLSSVVETDVSTEYCYDPAGKVLQKIQTIRGQALSLGYAYTPAGRLSAMALPNGVLIQYLRDAAGNVASIERVLPEGGRSAVVTDVQWTAFSAIKAWRAAARQVIWTYDLYGRVKGIGETGGDGFGATFGWDAYGNVKTIASKGVTNTLSYDVIGRLKMVSSDSGLTSYEYDKTGNRTRKQAYTMEGIEDITYRYATENHRLFAAGDTSYEYDASGNATRLGDRDFSYDERGRLSKVKVAGVDEMNYSYNASGQQVERFVAGAATVALYDEEGHWVGDYESSGTPLRQMVWLDDTPVAELDGERIYDIQSDHLGTPRALVDRSRDTIVWAWSIMGDAFGADMPNEDPDGDGKSVVFDMRFPGQRYDFSTGLFQNGFRDYDASTGRYAQSDPIGLNGGISSYVYAFSNPYGAIDPSGLVVRAKFHRSSGVFQIYDQDRPGTIYDVDARSGGKFASDGHFNSERAKQIPIGEYHIMGDRKNEWFRLDAADAYPLNDVHEQSGRDAFRLHPGTSSLGCVTIDRNADQYGFYSETIAPLIRQTRSVQTTDYSRKSLSVGWLPFSTRFGEPAREPITFYGTLEVLP